MSDNHLQSLYRTKLEYQSLWGGVYQRPLLNRLEAAGTKRGFQVNTNSLTQTQIGQENISDRESSASPLNTIISQDLQVNSWGKINGVRCSL